MRRPSLARPRTLAKKCGFRHMRLSECGDDFGALFGVFRFGPAAICGVERTDFWTSPQVRLD